jgi:hypothetical protein
MGQTYKPDKIILWLAKSQFPNKENDLPIKVTELVNYGLSIMWVDKDIKSYKKLIPTLKLYPNDIIITADDDLYYLCHVPVFAAHKPISVLHLMACTCTL